MVTPTLKLVNISDFIKLMDGGLAKSFESGIKDLRNQTRFSYTDIVKESEKDSRDVRIALLISGNTVIFVTRVLKKGTTVEINMVYTNPKFRGKGYCKNTLKKIIQKTRAVNFFLDVKKNNIPAISCYEKIGFIHGKVSGSILHMTYKKGSNATRKKV